MGYLQLELRLGVTERIGPLAKMLCEKTDAAGKVFDRTHWNRSFRGDAQSDGLRAS